MDSITFLEAIREQNLAVYRVSPTRLKEDIGQEAEIAHDYRGRLVYELLQNADDAMAAHATLQDRIVFKLTDDALWVGNSGRPLDEADVAGLSGIGASSKGEHDGPRRASIGHKGMGFKSVLEITETPEVYSTRFSLRMDAALALKPVARVMAELGEPAPRRVPAMRFPWPVDEPHPMWGIHRSTGINTLFRFPLRRELDEQQRALLAARLLSLPVTAVLFLKHLERVEVDVDTSYAKGHLGLTLSRRTHDEGDWRLTVGLVESGIFTVSIRSDDGDEWPFLLAHDRDVVIGDHRGGLDAYAWEGIEYAEVSLATPWPPQEARRPLPDSWRKFHVFLPTAEPSPYQVLINAAFATDLSRQQIRVGDQEGDYNRHLLKEAARVLRDELIPALQQERATTADILRMLTRADRGVAGPDGILHEYVLQALRYVPLLPVPGSPELIPIGRAIVPPPLGGDANRVFREILPDDAAIDGLRVPSADVCSAELAAAAGDLGARVCEMTEIVTALASADPAKSHLRQHPSGRVQIDPVLAVLEAYWSDADADGRMVLAAAVRSAPVFPVALTANGAVVRAQTDGFTCFLPPRHLAGDIPLGRLRFLLREVSWGELLPSERNDVLGEHIAAWTALFELREFKFADVMRASVLPALDLDPGDDAPVKRRELESIDTLAAICQLSGRTPKPGLPLPYERLGSDRALFNLARLPVPCRTSEGNAISWVPAFRAYFGTDWIGDSSVERILEAARLAGASEDDLPSIPFVVAPSRLAGVLERYSALAVADGHAGSDDEVSVDEDDEAALEEGTVERWKTFLSWLGVNSPLRPVHFHDVEDRATGWLTTRDLAKPSGSAFAGIGRPWEQYRVKLQAAVRKADPADRFVPYVLRLHDLEYLLPLLKMAASDESGVIPTALYEHLAFNWQRLDGFSRAQVGLVPRERDPRMRSKPIRPMGDEPREIYDDFWLWRLRLRAFVPTTHGPRKPTAAWLPSPEATRRFGRRHHPPGRLLPLVDVGDDLLRGRARGLANALGIREDLTPATFRPSDGRVLADRIAELYGTAAENGTLADSDLRLVIKPAYRHMFELLVGSGVESNAEAALPLTDAPLLVTDGDGDYRFKPGGDVLYVDRSGTRDRLGATETSVWAFILEATPAARGPLIRLFGARVLEDELSWSPSPSEGALDPAELRRFRRGLMDLIPYLLARLRVERNEEQQARTDARRLESFVGNVEPVQLLRVSATLEGVRLTARAEREAFVGIRSDGSVQAFVRWGSNGWPPTAFEAEALAAALTDLYQASMFEPFLALVQAQSGELRRRLLRMAGAPTDLDEVMETAAEHAVTNVTEQVERSAPGPDVEDEPTAEPSTQPADYRVPLWSPEQLVISGTPVIVHGEGPTDTEPSSRSVDGHPSGGRSYGGGTDLSELDRVGMSVALAFESARGKREGGSGALFSQSASNGSTAQIFDVSTPAKIRAAREASANLREALAFMADHGVSGDWPGVDIISLDSVDPTRPSRLIELKSSGVNATVQAMTWNEWKTARHSAMRDRFYLYLVGNLRSDLAGVRPYLRSIRDPFAALLSEVTSTTHTTRRVQLHVTQFQEAEYLELEIGTAMST